MSDRPGINVRPSSKLGGIIYLRAPSPPSAEIIREQISGLWNVSSSVKQLQSPDLLEVSFDERSFVIEFTRQQVPASLTQHVASGSSHWPEAGSALLRHKAYLSIATALGRHVGLDLAVDFTRLLIGCARVTDSVGVCWLNGPVLH